jgi:ParB/RepB/Spo0J family partition protein
MDTLAPTRRANRATPRSVPLDAIEVPPTGLRRAATTAEQDAGMADSVRRLGVLCPIILRAHPTELDRYILVACRRRLRAARDAGLPEIPAEFHTDLTDADAAAIEAAENLQRAAMSPVDTWRAIARLQDLGWQDQADIAATLGIPLRTTRRLAKLGQLHPTLLDAIEAGALPQDRELHAIASQPQETQAALLKKLHKGGAVPWWQIAEACHEKKIPKSRAIFDADASGLTWDEDLFAEPGTDWQWTTRDVTGFVAAQRAAVQAGIDAAKGKIAWGTMGQHSEFRLPKGHEHHWGWKWGEKLPRGTIGFVHVTELGEVRVACAKPPPKEKPAAAEEPQAPPPTAKPRFTEKGRLLIGERKTAALRSALRDRPPLDLPRATLLLLMALAGENVEIFDGAEPVELEAVATVANALWPHAAAGAPIEERLARLVQEVAARVLRCKPVQGYHAKASGNVAERVGQLLGAEQCLPRLDDEELLGTASVEALRAAAGEAGVAFKPSDTGKAIRAKLLGAAEQLVLFPEARFAADPLEFAPDGDWVTRESQCGQFMHKPACHACGWKESEGKDAVACGLQLCRNDLARLGVEMHELEETEDGLALALRVPAAEWEPDRSRPDAASVAVQRAEAAVAFAAAEAAAQPEPFACGWNGSAPCREEGTFRCGGTCPRRDAYSAWIATDEGKRARRAQQNADARASLKRPRKKGSTHA